MNNPHSEHRHKLTWRSFTTALELLFLFFVIFYIILKHHNNEDYGERTGIIIDIRGDTTPQKKIEKNPLIVIEKGTFWFMDVSLLDSFGGVHYSFSRKNYDTVVLTIVDSLFSRKKNSSAELVVPSNFIEKIEKAFENKKTLVDKKSKTNIFYFNCRGKNPRISKDSIVSLLKEGGVIISSIHHR